MYARTKLSIVGSDRRPAGRGRRLAPSALAAQPIARAVEANSCRLQAGLGGRHAERPELAGEAAPGADLVPFGDQSAA